MKRIIPFLSCLISFAHAQVEKFDMAYTLRVEPSQNEEGKKPPVTAEELKQSVFILQKRLKALGLKNSQVSEKDEEFILITAKSLSKKQAQELRKSLTTAAKLELKLVHPENGTLADKVATDPENEIVPGYEFKILRDVDKEGKATTENLLIKRRAGIEGSDIIHAYELYGPYEGQLVVTLNKQGAKKMLALTKGMNHGRDRLAIVLDGKVLSAPTVQSPLSKKFQISGMGDAKGAKKLAAALLNPLKNPLVIVEEKRAPSHILQDTQKKAAP